MIFYYSMKSQVDKKSRHQTSTQLFFFFFEGVKVITHLLIDR